MYGFSDLEILCKTAVNKSKIILCMNASFSGIFFHIKTSILLLFLSLLEFLINCRENMAQFLLYSRRLFFFFQNGLEKTSY